ncbi:MAG: RNA methyltransferase [Treponema sp.]|jgi:tRNA/rRNA methyltransferase/tRNA (cytidine32/uridine32-2'-O)-methyltransferase|nr:RNA methyltransferase [Treponema sp.]
MNLSDVVIILVRPEESGNVGAVCRAMKNCGLSRLRLAGASALDEAVIRARAVHAVDVWEKAGIFDALAPALADCGVVVGATRRRGHKRGLSMLPEETARFLQSRRGSAALVFGNERTGLEDEEIALCGLSSHIPTAEDFPSLNLSHAVQIFAYELFRALGASKPVPGEWTPMDMAKITELASSITDSLALLGFYKQRGREYQEKFFRDVVSRAGLSIKEGAYMKDIFAKAAQLAQNQER